MSSSRAHYDPFSRGLHWLTAIAVMAAFALGPEGFGRQMRQGLDPATRWDIAAHESLGLLVFGLTLLRLLWLAARPAAPQFAMPNWMRMLSKSAHGALWLLLLALPMSALLTLGSEGHPLTLLGGIRVDQLPLNREGLLATLVDWGEVHKTLGEVIVWLAGAHALAAIYHHVWLKDGVLRAMLAPRRG